jgi:hypothetical protein
MIGLFLPRLRVVSLLYKQVITSAAGPNRLMQPAVGICRNGPPVLTSSNEQGGGDDVSARI